MKRKVILLNLKKLEIDIEIDIARNKINDLTLIWVCFLGVYFEVRG